MQTNSKNKILIVTTNFPPSTSIGTQRLLKICRFIDKSIWEIHVLTLKKKFYSVKISNEDPYIRDSLSKVNVIRSSKIDINSMLVKFKNLMVRMVKNTTFVNQKTIVSTNKIKIQKKSSNILKEIFDLLEFPDKEIVWVPFAVINGLRTIKKNKIDTIFSTSPKHSCHLTTAILKLITGKRLIIEFRDPWARSPWQEEERNLNAVWRLKHKCIKIFEKLVVDSADRVILVTDKMKQNFQSHYHNIPSDKFAVFYNGYDPGLRAKIKPQAPIRNMENKKIIFSHIGSLYKKRNPEPIFRAIRKLVANDHKIRDKILFQFIGAITNDLRLISHIPEEYGIADVVKFIPTVNFMQSLDFMMQSDILILLQPVTKLQLPAKFFDYINMGKPVLAVAENNSEVQNIVRDRFGIFADYNNIDNIQKSIIEILNSVDDMTDRVVKNRSVYNFKNSIKNFQAIITI